MFDREGDDGKFVSVTVKATDQGEPSLEGVCSFTGNAIIIYEAILEYMKKDKQKRKLINIFLLAVEITDVNDNVRDFLVFYDFPIFITKFNIFFLYSQTRIASTATVVRSSSKYLEFTVLFKNRKMIFVNHFFCPLSRNTSKMSNKMQALEQTFCVCQLLTKMRTIMERLCIRYRRHTIHKTWNTSKFNQNLVGSY